MTVHDRVTVPFRKYAAFVVEWDPAGHDGERESWESMEARLDAWWAPKLAEQDAQETMDPPVTERETDRWDEQRRVLRWAWTLPIDVPPDLASRCSFGALRGYLTYELDPS